MKGRKSTELLYREMLGKSLFKERFFVFEDASPEAPAAPEAPKIGEEPKKEVKDFLELAYGSRDKMALPKEIDSAEMVAKDNPYITRLNKTLPTHAKDATGFVHSAGKLELYFYTAAEYDKAYKDTEAGKPGIARKIPIIGTPINVIDPLTPEEARADGEWSAPTLSDVQKKPPYTIEGFEYVALVWPKVRTVLGETLSDPSNRIPPSKINEMAQAAQNDEGKFAAFNQLVLQVARTLKAPGVDDPLVKKVVTEYKAFEVGVAKGIFGQRLETGSAGKVKREGLKDEVLAPYYKDYQKPDDSNKLALPKDAILSVPQFDGVRETVRREKYLINADIWNPVDKKGLAEVRYYWEKLGIRINEQPHAGILNELAKPFDQSEGGFMKTLPPNIDGNWFQEPGLHLPEIASFPAGKEYVKAWNYFNSVKEFCKAKDLQQRNSTKAINEFSQTKPVEVIKDGLKKNFDAVGTAIRTGDWGTVAFYAIGIMAVLKVAKMHGGGDFVKKWGSYVVGGYFLVKVLDKAGYDASGKLGLKKKFEDLTGTAMENVLDYADMPEFREIDPGVALHSLKMSARQLYLAKESSHVASNGELGWVDPAKFPAYRDAFIGETRPAKPGSEYDRVGHELYKMIMALETLYIRKLSSNPNSEFHGISFENALNDPDLQDSKVEHWLSVMAAEGKDADEAMITGASQRFAKGLEGKMLDPQIRTIEIKGKKMIGGKIMGVPVVIIQDGKFYKVYSRIKYEKDPKSDPLKGGIPVEGDGKIEGLDEALKLEFMEQLKHKLEGGQRIPMKGGLRGAAEDSGSEDGEETDEEAPELPTTTAEGVAQLAANDLTEGVVTDLAIDGDRIKMEVGRVKRSFRPDGDFEAAFVEKFEPANGGAKEAMAFLLETLKGVGSYNEEQHGTPGHFEQSQADIEATVVKLRARPEPEAPADGGAEPAVEEGEGTPADTFDAAEMADKVKWDGTQWSYISEPPGRSSTYKNDFGVDVPTTTITVQIGDNGEVTHDVLNTPEKMLLTKIADDPNTAALAPFLNSDGMKVKKLVPKGSEPAKVVLIVGGVETVLLYNGGRFEEAPRAQSLLKNNTFRFEYAKLMEGRGMPMELSNEFKELEDEIGQLDGGIWQDVVSGWRKITGDTKAQLTDGAIPRKRTLAILGAQKYALAQKLRKGAEMMTSLTDFSDFHTKTIADAQSNIERAKANISAFIVAAKRSGKQVSNEDFQRGVVAEINSITGGSNSYKESMGEITDINYRNSWGILSGDLGNQFHFENADQLKAFAYYAVDSVPYTATIKLPDGTKEPKKEAAVSLDPPPPYGKTTTVNYVNPWEDPGERGYYILGYNEYVQNAILAHNGDLSNPGVLRLEPFAEWCDGHRMNADRVKPLAPYNHDDADRLHNAQTIPLDKVNNLTDLDKAVMDEFEAALQGLINAYPDDFRAGEASDILHKEFTPGMTSLNVGILETYQSGNSGGVYSKLWTFSEQIAHLKTRKQQENEIKRLVDEKFMQVIFSDPERYFVKPVPLSERIVRAWPGILKIPIVGSWFLPN